MTWTDRCPLALALTCAGALMLSACSIEVRENLEGTDDVDIRTPFGHGTVRGDPDPATIGVPVYPGARPLYRDGDNQSANVNIGNGWFGLEVVAATFASDDAEGPIVEFYRRELQKHGEVTECRGNLDFKGRRRSRPVCRHDEWSEKVQLAAGSGERYRIVVVTPRRTGSKLALVYVASRG